MLITDLEDLAAVFHDRDAAGGLAIDPIVTSVLPLCCPIGNHECLLRPLG